MEKQKKPLHKMVWLWVVIGIAIVAGIVFVANMFAAADIVEPDSAPHTLEYNGRTTTWLYEIPCEMELPVGILKLEAIYFGETKTDEGHSTVMHIEFTLPQEMPREEIKWFWGDDFSGSAYIGGEENDINISFGFGRFGAAYTNTETEKIGNTIYVVSKLQRNARYSVIGNPVKLILNYETKTDSLSFVIERTITEDIAANFDGAGKVTAVGDAAAAYIARRAETLVGE